MNYVGIDWAYGRAAYCAMGEGGEIKAEGLISADEDGLAKLVLKLGTEAKAAVEMMSGAVWVRDRLEVAGWQVQVAHARKVRDVAPLACKTDRVDARVLAELRRRELVPELWLPSPEDRALRERLRRRAHLVKTRTSARNRIFGLLTQFGLRISHARLRKPDGIELLERRGVPAVWRASITELLELSKEMDCRIDPIDRELAPLARRDERAKLLATIPGVGPLLSLTFAAEIGEVSRFSSPRKLVGYAGLAPRINQSGDRSATGALSKAGSRTLRWAAVEAANQAWRPSNPWHEHYLRIAARHGKNPAKSAVARKLLIAAWHMLSRREPFKPAPASSRCFLTA
ncbi:MAG TPA: IS110 family transposase [Solirubrobacterales bacterium]|nr:IS110 family transposase [Solirubrobacterales bacterium]